MPPRKYNRVPLESLSQNTTPQITVSQNGAKRGLEDDLRGEGEAPQAKRISTGATSGSSLPIATKWAVAGRYKITDSDPSLTCEDYSLKLYWEEGTPCQLYATFKFGELEGIMRMHPSDALSIPFEKACELEKAKEPSPTNHTWLTRWRGKDGGMRLDKLIGGETNNRGVFSITESQFAVGGAVQTVLGLDFMMLYNDQRFRFKAEKDGDLGRNDHPEAPKSDVEWRGIEEEWSALEDPEWSRITTTQTPAPSSRPLPLASASVASASSNFGGVSRSGTQKKAVVPIERCPEWAFPVAGKWTLDVSNFLRDIPHIKHAYPDGIPPFTLDIKYSNNAAHKRIGRQLWGTFRWADLSGCMRFCPGNKNMHNHLQFNNACLLDKGVWPGPSPDGVSVWNFRLKAEGDDTGVIEETDEYETQLEFTRDADGTMKLAGKMVLGGYKARKISGLKIGENPPPTWGDRTVDSVWKSLKYPSEGSWRDFCRPCKGDLDDSSESETDNEPEIDWDARWKERSAQRAKEKLEEEQPWPSEMTGLWDITPRDKSTMDGEDPDAPRYMHIYLENNDAGRQYWAEFQFGNEWAGVMRLCPNSDDIAESEKTNVEKFEQRCILKEGVRAGPPPEGINSWLIKWRGTLVDKLEKYMPEKAKKDPKHDAFTTNFTVKRGEDDTLVLRGVIVEGCIIRSFTGVRIGDEETRGASDPTIATLWKKNAWIPPPPPKLWPWKSPIPNPCIQRPPEWAWDVLGKWEITAPNVAEALEIGEGEPLTMTIRMANALKPSTARRTLWATFKFGTKIQGCMRFCPLEENSRPAPTIERFENKTMLQPGVWPGDSISAPGLSYQKWGLRWRAAKKVGNQMEILRYSDDSETAFNFQRGEDGALSLRGLFTVGWQPKLWRATKIKDRQSVDAYDERASSVWSSFDL